LALRNAFGADRVGERAQTRSAKPREAKMSENQRAQAKRHYIDEFGPTPTAGRQIITLAVAGAAMVVLSVVMNYFGLT
jgi:hypothetical protein